MDASAADCRSSSSWIWRDTASGGGSASSAACSWEVEDEARGAPLKVPCTWKIAKRARTDDYFRAAEQTVCPSVHANIEKFSFCRCKAYTSAAWHPSDHCHSRSPPTIIRLGAMLLIGFPHLQLSSACVCQLREPYSSFLAAAIRVTGPRMNFADGLNTVSHAAAWAASVSEG